MCDFHLVLAWLDEPMLFCVECMDECMHVAHEIYFDTCLLGLEMSWNFYLPIYALEWTFTLEDHEVTYIPGRITLPSPKVFNAARSSMRLRCGSRGGSDASSGGLGQKLPPIFLIGWGLT